MLAIFTIRRLACVRQRLSRVSSDVGRDSPASPGGELLRRRASLKRAVHAFMRIKVCCIQSEHEAWLAIRGGAHALGLVSEMPSGPRMISDSLIRRIVESVPPTYLTVLLSARTEPAGIVEHQRATRANALQLVGQTSPAALGVVRAELPGVALFKVVHVEDESSIELALSFSDVADALLLDTGSPNASVPELGGTGRTHDWRISREIVRSCPKPVFLAGGLDARNVEEAIRKVEPFGVDVCSGLRPGGALDESRLRDFVDRVTRVAASREPQPDDSLAGG